MEKESMKIFFITSIMMCLISFAKYIFFMSKGISREDRTAGLMKQYPFTQKLDPEIDFSCFYLGQAFVEQNKDEEDESFKKGMEDD